MAMVATQCDYCKVISHLIQIKIGIQDNKIYESDQFSHRILRPIFYPFKKIFLASQCYNPLFFISPFLIKMQPPAYFEIQRTNDRVFLKSLDRLFAIQQTTSQKLKKGGSSMHQIVPRHPPECHILASYQMQFAKNFFKKFKKKPKITNI